MAGRGGTDQTGTDQGVDLAERRHVGGRTLLQVDPPCSEELAVGRVAAPQTLDQLRRRRDLTVKVLLPLFLLYLQGEPGPEDALVAKQHGVKLKTDLVAV